ncbi:hypothetical protein [Paraburkholderia flagellata]|uniref:hypothetical protein n=1 Tax=Paraburkholderia flagellata TaxID=2883241 RepID=UPI001F3F873A|nr:hypothetical protein [Paraburkholderia flagellata]
MLFREFPIIRPPNPNIRQQFESLHFPQRTIPLRALIANDFPRAKKTRPESRVKTDEKRPPLVEG